ncbi:MAG TPA: fatty acyl-CoA synthetase [Mycobacteriales bacterium]|jgi:fatty-acyl-CoA synthase|nr:fatty acyl-CoA synthetase [Mycobacteriales bacterium]
MSAEPGAPRDDVTALVAQARSHALGDIPRRTAARFPDKIGLIDGAVRLSYRELDATIDRIAAALADRGLVRGDRLALLSRNCWQFVALTFATARLGVVLVPINFMLGAEEVAFILRHSGAVAMVTQDSLGAVAEQAVASAPGQLRIRGRIGTDGGAAADWEDLQAWVEHDGTPPPVVVGDDEPLRLMYTSGTESRPKGVLLSSRALMWQYVSCVIEGGLDASDVELHSLPLYHCAQLDVFLGPNLYLGGTNILLPAPDPGEILAFIARERVTKIFCPPTVWIALLRHPEFDRTDLSSLDKGYYGASPMPVEVLRELQHRLPDVRLWNLYGQTELSPLATLLPPHEQLSHAGSAGRAVLNVETRVVDDRDVTVAVGEIGEIVHRSPQATLGYYRDPDATANAFRGGWFHSGDLGVMDAEGRVTVVDRKKDMIKSGGENVASREVEECIYELDGVAEAAVFAVDHPRWVEAVAAVVVPKPGANLLPAQVIAHCREQLAGFKCPKYVVIAESLPKNPSGKILKRQLRTNHAQLAQPTVRR